MARRVPLYLLILLSLSGFCQEIKIDSTRLLLKGEVQSAVNKIQKVKALTALGEYEIEYNLKKAETHLLEALELAESSEVQPQDVAYIYNQLGVINRRKGDYGEAISFYLKSKDLYEKHKDTSNVADVIHNMGLVYRFHRKDSIAIKNFAEAIRLNRQMKDTFSLAAAHNMIGVSYRRMNQYDSALINYDKARKLFTSLGNEEDVIRVDQNIAVVYSNTGQYEKSLPLKLAFLEYKKRQGKKMSISSGYYSVSRDYSRLKLHEKAKKYADSSLQIALEEGYKEQISKAYVRRSAVYRDMKNFEQAYQDYRMFKKHSDSIFGYKSAERIKELELKYQLEKEKSELEILSEVRRNKVQLYSILFIITLVVGGLVGYLIWRNYKTRNRIMASELEKEKLKKELLDEKVKVSESELKFLIADNSMRLQFVREFFRQIKEDKKRVHSTDVKQYTQSLIPILQQQIATESKLSTLQDKIEGVNRGFHEKLIKLYPSLTKTEREVCTLFRLNLSVKEISVIRNTTAESTRVARHRIRKKLNIPRETELEKFIQSL